MPSSSQALEIWIRWASQRLGKKLSDSQVEMYVEEMQPWDLDQEQLIRLERIVRRRSDGMWPTCYQLRDFMLRVQHRPETEPIFRTMQDADGRCYARATSYRHEVIPDEETLERWKAEKCTAEEAREIWNREFYLATGSLPELPNLPMISGVPVTPEAILEIPPEKKFLTAESQEAQSAEYADRSDFDDSPGGPEDFADAQSFDFSPEGVEVEYLDEPESPAGSPFDEL